MVGWLRLRGCETFSKLLLLLLLLWLVAWWGALKGPEAPPLQSGLLQLSRLARGELEG